MGARGRTIAYVPALDGLRGLAVGGVLAFHAGVGLPGGFIGVSVFFTLSGYLITTLLLAEHETQGRVSLAGFYSRRARRLLPASLTCLIAVTLAGPWWSATQQDHLPGDVWAALANVANWRFAVAEHSYAELFRADPSPVAHYWSLAIEEQLYLLLPLVVVLCLCRSRRTLLAVTAGLVALSLAATVTASDLNLAYHGTHTRGAELLIGALLAQVGVDRLVRRGGSDLLGAAALAGLILAMATTHVEDRWLYRGGWVAIGLASAAVICAASSGGVVARRLSAPRLVAFGRISYGVYLYHWPLFLLLDEGRTGLSGWPLVAVRIAATMAVATASSRWIELPVRNGRLCGARLAWPLAASGVAVAVLALVAVPAPSFTSTERLLDRGDGGPLVLSRGASARRATAPLRFPAPDDAPRTVVLVVGSDPTAARSLTGPDLVVIDATDPQCPTASGQAALTATGPVDISRCWPAGPRVGQLVDANQADVVVLSTGPLDRAQVRLATQPDFARAGDWVGVDQRWRHVRDDLRAAIDSAAARGAAVVVSDAGPPDGPGPDLFDDQLGAIAVTAESLAAIARTPEALLASVRALGAETGTERRELRVVVIGDSTSLVLARALGDAAPDRLSVVWGGQNGCPLVDVTATRSSRRADWAPSPCLPLDRSLRPLLARYRPDVVLVAAVLGEVAEQRYQGDPSAHVAGDPAFTAVHDRAMNALLAMVEPYGSSVVVADTPAIRPGVFASAEMCNAERLRAWNAQISRWDEQHRSVAVLGLAAALADYEAVAGDIRPDGVHPEVEALTALAGQQLVGDLLEAWQATAAPTGRPLR